MPRDTPPRTPPLPAEVWLAGTPKKINVLIKPGKRQADYSPAPSQGRACENKPMLIVLAAPPLPDTLWEALTDSLLPPLPD